MKRLTSKVVIDCHLYMARRYGFELVQKADSELMIAIGHGLDVMGIMDHEKFMKRFAVSIVEPIFGRRLVWIPWTPGRGNQASRIKQCEVLAHESKHIVDGAEDPRYGPKYLTSKSYRSHAEVKALMHQMTVHKHLTGRVPNTARLANGLVNYRVRKRDRRVTKVELDIIAAALRRGAVPPGPGKVMVDWLKRKGYR